MRRGSDGRWYNNENWSRSDRFFDDLQHDVNKAALVTGLVMGGILLLFIAYFIFAITCQTPNADCGESRFPSPEELKANAPSDDSTANSSSTYSGKTLTTYKDDCVYEIPERLDLPSNYHVPVRSYGQNCPPVQDPPPEKPKNGPISNSNSASQRTQSSSVSKPNCGYQEFGQRPTPPSNICSGSNHK